ncbi:hypothetical protein Btru_001493 [Bulinus truncatus]|nr:hypothetical protein Btru_001493 [Bulinus truncatus]
MCGLWVCCRGESEKDECKRLLQHNDFNVAVIGDVGCGKTSLIYRFTRGRLPDPEVPCVLHNDRADVNRNGVEITLHIRESAGSDEAARMRNVVYQDSHVIIVCFPIDNPKSLHDVEAEWGTELRHLCRQTPFLLVGTKKDARKALGAKAVSKKDGKKTSKKIGALSYMEYSALDEKYAVRDSKMIFGRAIQECLKRKRDNQ